MYIRLVPKFRCHHFQPFHFFNKKRYGINALPVAVWWLFPSVGMLCLMVLLIHRLYQCHRRKEKIKSNLVTYYKTVHDTQKSLELLNEPLKEISSNPKLDENLRDKIRLAIWRLNTLQSSLNAFMGEEKKVGERLQSATALKSIETVNTQDTSIAVPDTPVDLAVQLTNSDQHFLEKVFSIIREHYVNPDFNVDTLSQKMGMSRSSFYNRIKAISGQAPADFIRQYRMERAKELLRTRQYTIAEVAFRSGFTDVKYFRDVFRKKFDRSPSQYAKFD